MNLPKDDPVANKSPIAQKEAPLLLGDKYPKGLNHSKIEVWMYVYVCVYIYIYASVALHGVVSGFGPLASLDFDRSGLPLQCGRPERNGPKPKP